MPFSRYRPTSDQPAWKHRLYLIIFESGTRGGKIFDFCLLISIGLSVTMDGIEPDVLLSLLRRQTRVGSGASSRDIVRAAEESIADTLIEAKQKGYSRIALAISGERIVALPAK